MNGDEHRNAHSQGSQPPLQISCQIDGTRYSGPAIELPGEVDPAAVLAAIRDGDAGESEPAAEITCPSPGPLFEHVGHVRAGMGLRTRTALARAGRSRGLTTPYDERVRALREELDGLTVPEGDLKATREAVATHEQSVAQLRERAAAARGRLQARRELDGETAEATADLREAIEALAEHETEAVAARQELESGRAAARQRRDRRERRFELEERIANRQREARGHLVDQLREEFADALAALPEATPSDPFAAEPVPAALAIARVGDPAAPVVLATDPFESATTAHEFLGAAVVRL